jgi:hypothetical protein
MISKKLEKRWTHDNFGVIETVAGMDEQDLADSLKYGLRDVRNLILSWLVPEKQKELKQLIKKSKISKSEGKRLFEIFNTRLEENRKIEIEKISNL